MNQVRLESLAPREWPSPAVTIGNFDGVHRGHRTLIDAAARWAEAERGTVVVLTLDPHPARLLDPERAPTTLTTVEQKGELLAALGVDVFAVLPFTAALAERSAEDFVRRVLVQALGARRVVIGEDFRFGHRREGDVGRLRALGEEHGFGVEALAPVVHEGRPISSSRVREALARGEVAEARALLGRAFFLDGKVVAGERRGRTLGFPTANLDTPNETLPRVGVYAARCRVPSADWIPAVVNIGRRPTFGGGGVSVEAHLIDHDADLYGADLRTEFVARLRDERRFDGPGELVAQIGEDVARARTLVADRPPEGV
jgi:riboflavin kinase/FMN adenylyltransferase